MAGFLAIISTGATTPAAIAPTVFCGSTGVVLCIRLSSATDKPIAQTVRTILGFRDQVPVKDHLIPTPALHRWAVDLFRAARSTGRESAPTADHPVGASLAAHQIFRALTIPDGFKSPFA